jgi:hypothetical protein
MAVSCPIDRFAQSIKTSKQANLCITKASIFHEKDDASKVWVACVLLTA